MPLTPIDVQQKTFATALRGYDLDEVDDFLDNVVIALKDYEQRLSDAQERISILETEVSDRGDSEGAIARALVAAQRSADAIVADAKVDAEGILESARTQSVDLASQRDAKELELRGEVERVQTLIDSLRAGVAELANMLPAQLDEMDEIASASLGALETSDGATFDAAEPVDEYSLSGNFDTDEALADAGEIADPFEDLSTESVLASGAYSDDLAGEDGDLADGHRADEEDTDEADESDTEMDPDGYTEDGAADESDVPDSGVVDINNLAEQIDSAFDEAASADDQPDGGFRPWEG